MHITQLFIQRPVLSTVVNLLVVLMGIISYQRLTLREYPRIEVPVVSITTNYLGANSKIVETDVTQVLEDALSGIDGVDVLSTTSLDGVSKVTVSFNLERDPEAAANDVRDRVARVRNQLPEDTTEPVIAKTAADADPIIWIALSSSKHSDLEVSEFADRYVKDKLEVLSGVAQVLLGGERRKAMRIWLRNQALAGVEVTTTDIEQALLNQNISFPSGRIEGKEREFAVLPETELNQIIDFENLIVKKTPDLVRLKEVARVELGPQDDRLVARFNGKQALGLGIIKQATANPLSVIKEVKQALPKIRASLPEGMEMEVAYDSTIFISQSITQVFKTLAEAIVLVVLVIYLFLKNWRATLIPLLAIPISLIGSLLLLHAFNCSLNTLTLLALVLAIGLVVDDAIVVVENIHRHLEKGLSPLEAAIKGGKEIGLAIIAMTLTLAAVFLPVIFAQGQTGQLFSEFGVALAGSVLISGFVALTLSMMLCAKWLRLEKQAHNEVPVLFKKGLDQVLSRPKWVLVFGGVTVLITAFLLFRIPEELSPLEDRGFLIGLALGPEGSSLSYMDRYTKQLENIFAETPDVQRYFVLTGYPLTSQAISFVGLKPWGERRSQMLIAQEFGQKFFQIPGVMAFPINPPSLGGKFSGQPISFVLQSTGEYEQLNEQATALMGKIRENPKIINLDVDLKLNKPQLILEFDRSKIANLNIDITEIGRTLEIFLASKEITKFEQQGKRYDVVVQGELSERDQITQLNQLLIKTNTGAFVPLGNIVKIHQTVAPRELNRFNKMRSATITGATVPGYALGEALSFIEGKATELGFVSYDFSGESREFKKSQGTFWTNFLLAIIVVYLVLAAQFESFIDPVVILCTAPLAVFGALITLFLCGGTLNIYSQVGLIALIGLITKHGILIVEFANAALREGMEINQAIYQAVLTRFRPILMTTAATVLGALPLIFSSGAGHESRSQIGLVIVGGMIGGSLFTLAVVPTIYVYLKRSRAR